MGTTGSVAFTFNRMGEFKIKSDGQNIDELELELIDYGLEEIGEDSEGNIVIRAPFNEYGNMAKVYQLQFKIICILPGAFNFKFCHVIKTKTYTTAGAQ